MPRDFNVYLEDVLNAIEKIDRYVANITFDTFIRDEKTVDAVARNLEIVGEAIKKVPLHVRQRHTEVEWKKIAGLRDILIHAYFGIDATIIWDVVREKLPVLKQQVEQILRE